MLSFLRLIPNCIFKAKSERRKLFIGDQLEECKDYSGLFYVLPFQKGFLVNWDVEKQIWDYMFGKEVMKVIRYSFNTVVVWLTALKKEV